MGENLAYYEGIDNIAELCIGVSAIDNMTCIW